MKKLFSLICFVTLIQLFFVKPVYADISSYDWAKYYSPNTGDETIGIATLVDSSGNAYVISVVYGTSTYDFDPSGGTDNQAITNMATVITKYNTSGTYVWSKVINSDNTVFTESAAIDSNDNIFLIGYIYGTTDFDPGAGTTNLTSAGFADVFIAKYNSDGDLQWANRFGEATYSQQGFRIDVDSDNNIIVVGRHQNGTADYDPGAGTSNLTSAATFYAKYDTSGNLVWINGLATTVDNNEVLFTDSSGNSYYAEGVKIHKYNSSGTLVWTKSIGATIKGGDADPSDNLYFYGKFSGSNIDFDPGAGSETLTANGSDLFILKLDSDGTFQWVRQITGSSSIYNAWDYNTRGIAVTDTQLFAFGAFAGTYDFDGTSGGTDEKTAGASVDQFFITNYTLDGNYVDTYVMGLSNGDLMNQIFATSSDVVTITGYAYSASGDFDPFSTDTVTSPSANGAYYLARYSTTDPDTTAPTFSAVTATANSSSATVTWTSNEAASSQIEYGLTTSYGSTTTENDTSTRVTSHSQTITGLTICTTYHYRVKGSDAASNSGTGSDGTFLTRGCPSTNITTTTTTASPQIPQESVEAAGGIFTVLDGSSTTSGNNGVQRVSVVLESKTFNYDAFLSSSVSTPTTPILLPNSINGILPNPITGVVPTTAIGSNTVFAGSQNNGILGIKTQFGIAWQVGNIHNTWYKAYAPGYKTSGAAHIIPELQAKASIIAFSYTEQQLVPPGNPNQKFLASNLKLAHSLDGIVWNILPTSVVDTENRTVAALDKVGGYYMIVSPTRGVTSFSVVRSNENTLGVQTELDTKSKPKVEKIEVPKDTTQKDTTENKQEVKHVTPESQSKQKQSFLQRIGAFIQNILK